MAAPMSMRVTAAFRWYLLCNQRNLISNQVTGTTRCLPRHYLNICKRCLSSKIDDKQKSQLSSSKAGETHGNDVSGAEADDFFGILENLRTPVPTFSGDTDSREPLIVETEHLNQERVLDVHFGFIRRDSDNPALPRDNRGKIKLSKSSSDVPKSTHESADFFSRLLGHGQESDSGSNQIDSNFNGQSTSFRQDGGATDNKRQILQRARNSDSVQPEDHAQTHVDVDGTEPNFIDEQYFDNKYLSNSLDVSKRGLKSVKVSERASSVKQEHAVNSEKDDGSTVDEKDTMGFIDNQYFEKSDDQSLNETSLHLSDVFQEDFNSFPKNVSEKHETAESDMHFVDDQYFGTIKVPQNNSQETISDDGKKSYNVKAKPSESGLKISRETSQETDHHRVQASESGSSDGESEISNENIVLDKVTRQSKRLSKKVKPNLEEPKTAFDMAMKIRLENAGRVTSVLEKNEKGIKAILCDFGLSS